MNLLEQIKQDRENISDFIAKNPNVTDIKLSYENQTIEELQKVKIAYLIPDKNYEYLESENCFRLFYTDNILVISARSKPCKVVTTYEIITE
jgi:hypothetical protein